MDSRDEFIRQLETLCARARDVVSGGPPPLVAPIYQTSVWQLESLEQCESINRGAEGYIYTRDGNPNHTALERLVAQLEGAPAALVTASGMAAISVALLTLASEGDHVIASDTLYGATTRLLGQELGRFGVDATFVPAHDVEAATAAFRPGTKAMIVETLSNPLTGLADVPYLGELCRESGAALIVDHTFAPTLSRPLEQGASVVMHSLTKFIGGHSDLTLGALAGSEEFIASARARASIWGMCANPFECWLALRGAATLPLRMERACANAAEIAGSLARHPKVLAAHYPGLRSHPQHARCREVLASGGPMLSFDVGNAIAADTLLRSVRLLRFAPSLGDTMSTLSYPAMTSHRALSPEERARLGITDGLLRLSVGIDAAEHVIADLEQALAAV